MERRWRTDNRRATSLFGLAAGGWILVAGASGAAAGGTDWANGMLFADGFESGSGIAWSSAFDGTFLFRRSTRARAGAGVEEQLFADDFELAGTDFWSFAIGLPSSVFGVPTDAVTRTSVESVTMEDLADPVLFRDGFESGDASAWSSVVGPIDQPPIADAGPDQTVTAGTTVQLDGAASSDPEGSTVLYSWSIIVAPTGSAAALSAPTAQSPTFVADLPGVYVAELVVDDGTAASAPDTATITAEAPVVTVTATDAEADEEGTDPGSFTVERTGDTSFALAVTFSVDGTADNGTDTAPIATLLEIPAGASSLVVDVLPVDDSEVEDAETVILGLTAEPYYSTGTPDTATVTIADNDNDVSIIATDASASEAGTDPGTFTMSRIGTTVRELVVHYTITGTAANGIDYDVISSTVTLPAGSAEGTVTVTPIDDSEFEDPETVRLTLLPDPAYAIGLRSQATVTIADDEKPLVTLTTTDDLAGEVGPDPGAFTVERTGPTSDPLEVHYSIGGSAQNGTDYETIASSATIPAGETAATIDITPVVDAEIEGAEGVVLSLDPDPAYAVGIPSLAVLSIKDAVTVTIVATDPDAAEVDLDPGLFTVTRNGGDLGNDLPVVVSRGGTANSGADYSTIVSILTIPANETSATIVITPLKDNRAEGSESVELTIAAGGLSYVPGSPSTATVLIADDPPVVSVSASDPDAAEAGADPGVFTFARSGGDLTQPLTVRFVFGGNAVNGSDFAVIASNVSIPAGLPSATVTIVPLPDNAKEGAETFTVTIDPAASYVIAVGTSQATVTIEDDPAVVTAVASDPLASEVGLDPGEITFSRSGGNLAAALLLLVQPGGTAANGLDYGSLGGSNIPVTIPAGASSATITISPLQDNLAEGTEAAVFTITPQASYAVGSPGSATVEIFDDPPVVGVTATDPDAAEAEADPGVFTFTRTGGKLSAPLSVSYSFGGSAINTSDFTFTPGSVTIPADQTSTDVTITPLPDNAVEGAESLILTITAKLAYQIDPAHSQATVAIADDPPVVTVEATDPDAAEAGLDPGTFSFSRSGGNLAVTLVVSAQRSGSATSGIDYESIGGSNVLVSIPATQSTTTVTITPRDDVDVEGPETAILTVAPLPSSYVIGAPATATVTIADDD